MQTIRHLNLELTSNCNQRCIYCFNESGPRSPHRDIALDDWKAFLAQQVQGGLRSVHFTGGEPFVNRGALQLLDYAQQLGLQTSVLSNGLRLGKLVLTHRPQFAALTVIQISLDTVDAARHDVRRGKPGAWRDAIAAIKALYRASVPCEISCTVSEENIGDLERIARFCKSLRMKLIARRLEPTGRGPLSGLTPVSEGALRTALQSIEARYPNVLTTDRFQYVPTSLTHDQAARTAGIVTVLPSGEFRSGPVLFPSHDRLFGSVGDLLAA